MSSRSPFVIRQAARVAPAHDDDAEQLGDDGDRQEDRAEPDDLGRSSCPRSPGRPPRGRSAARRGRRADVPAMSAPRATQRRASGRSNAPRARQWEFGDLPARPFSQSPPATWVRPIARAGAGSVPAPLLRSATSAAPTIPASLVRAAGTISTPTSISGSHLSALRLAPPPTMISSGEKRNTMRAGSRSTRSAHSFHDRCSRSRALAAALVSASLPSSSRWPSSVFGTSRPSRNRPTRARCRTSTSAPRRSRPRPRRSASRRGRRRRRR